MKPLLLVLSLCAAAGVARAEAYRIVADQADFLTLVEGRELRLGLFGIALQVTPDGRIAGEAQGNPVTGTWSWQDGYFGREMFWGERAIPYNCQLVEAQGASVVRFTVDQGAGQSAAFNLR